MDDEYYQLTAQLDAREVLRFLNNLGIHNISGEVLKYFITDLKKFIKYDLQQKYKQSNDQENVHIQGPERLHSASTFSSRIRSRTSEGTEINCSRNCVTRKRTLHVRNTHSAPNVRQEVTKEPLRRACSCVRVEKKDSTTNQPKVTTTTTTLNNNIIRVPKQQVKKKCDPVTLYHYYTSLWEKYKHNVPGENNWADLRWSVRQKMAGCKGAQIKVSEVPSQQKTGDK